MGASGTLRHPTHGVLRWATAVLLLAVFLLHGTGFMPLPLLTRIEAWTYDERVRMSARGGTSDTVVILDMDERTLAAEGWPLPRSRLATLVDLLFERHGVRVLGSDIVFSEPDRSGGAALLRELARGELADLPGFAARAEQLAPSLDADARFAESLRDRPVVLAAFFKPGVAPGEPVSRGALCAPLLGGEDARSYAVDFVQARGWGGNLPVLQQATPHCGYVDNPTLDPDGVYRRVALLQQYGGALYPSLALAVVRLALGEPALALEFSPPDSRTSLSLDNLQLGGLRVPVDGDLAALVPYRARSGAFSYVSVTDVLNGRVDDARLRGRIALLGTSAAGLLDLRTTPLGPNYAGVEIHAHLVAGMLDGTIKRAPAYRVGIEFTQLLLVALLFGALLPRLTPMRGAALVLGVLASLVAFALWMWSAQDFVVPLGLPVVFALVLGLAYALPGRSAANGHPQPVSTIPPPFEPPRVAAGTAADNGAGLHGPARGTSVLHRGCADLAAMAGTPAPGEPMQVLHALQTCQTVVVRRPGGTGDPEAGDGLTAAWGGPPDNPDHARHALQAALDLHAALHAALCAAGCGGAAAGPGIGVSSAVGRDRVSLAAPVGCDAARLAARISRLARLYGVSVLCTEFTRGVVGTVWAFREIDLVRFDDGEAAVAIYEPLGPKENLDPALREDLARHRGGMQLYRAQRWDEAEAVFRALDRGAHPHPVYALFIRRIRALRREPPGADWDGAYRHPLR